MRHLRRAALLALILAALLPGLVTAHAMLLSSTPDVDSTLATLPPAIVLTFDDDLTTDSNYVVVSASGSTVAIGALDPSNAKSLTGPMPALPNGTYEVRWTAISGDDNFVERGSFKFSVARPSVPPPTPTPAASASAAPSLAATPTTEPSPTPAPSASGGTNGGSSTDVLIPIAAMVVVIGGGLAWFLRRRGAA